MNQDGEKYDLRKRTLDFALRIIRLSSRLPNTPEGWTIRKQIVKSGTSPGAHYREACRARSVAEFISKIEGGLQELDETAYWFELLVESERVPSVKLQDLMQEANELIAIFVTSIKTSEQRS